MQPDKQQEVNGHNKQQQQQKLSKKQLKKLKKKQQWQKIKVIKRTQKRKQLKEKKKSKIIALKSQQHNRNPKQQQKEQTIKEQPMRKRKDDYIERMKLGIKVVIDLQFYDMMCQKEQNSLIKQLSYCHSVNRRYNKSFNFILSSLDEKKRQCLKTKYNCENWGITFEDSNIIDLYGVQNLIYLTGDAKQQLDEFQPKQINLHNNSQVYVIGGIVDHNRMKCLTYNWALQHKVRTRRLPLHSVKLCASVHLAVNHVWQWMLAHYNGTDWDIALQTVIPTRKIIH